MTSYSTHTLHASMISGARYHLVTTYSVKFWFSSSTPLSQEPAGGHGHTRKHTHHGQVLTMHPH